MEIAQSLTSDGPAPATPFLHPPETAMSLRFALPNLSKRRLLTTAALLAPAP
jgi:hypothetical protein